MRRQFPQDQAPWFEDAFQSLDRAAQEALLGAGTQKVLEEGDRVDGLRNAILRIESGLVKFAVTSDDRNLCVGLYGPNDSIVTPLFDEWDAGLYFVEAQEQTEVRIIPQEAILQAAAQSPTLMKAIMKAQGREAYQLMYAIRMLAFFNLPQRVAQVLLNLAAMFGAPDAKRGVRLHLRFTQEELAEMAGARRETLSTVLQDFREDDILDLRYARIDIRDFDALASLAGAESLPYLKNDKVFVTKT
jgi:CRP/FNR family transcriptional regulator, cyclic AMP receptor protein